MSTLITNPSAGDLSPVDKFHVVEGGTGGQTEVDGLNNLGGIDRVMKGAASGPVPLNENRKIPLEYLSDLNPNALGINGPLTVRCGSITPYQLTNYDSYDSYNLEATSGSGYIDGNHVYYTAPDQAGPCGFSVNNRSIVIMAVEGMITTPSIISPLEGIIPEEGTLIVQGSVFESIDTGQIIETFTGADCELSYDSSFFEVIYGIYGNPSTTFTFSNFRTQQQTFIRIRYHGIERVSDWSPLCQIEQTPAYINKPTFIYPTQGSTAGTGDPVDPYKTTVALNIQLNPFSTTNLNDSFHNADYEVATDPDFNNVISSSYYSEDGEYWQASGLNYSTLYYVRARHRGWDNESNWSDVIQFMSIPDGRYIVKPVIQSASLDLSKSQLTYIFTGSAYDTVGYSENILSSNWQISTDINFANLIYDGFSTQVQSIGVELGYSSVYYARVKYTDQFLVSQVSDVYTLSTSVDDRRIVKPLITSPTNNESLSVLSKIVTSSAMLTASSQVSYNDTHISSDWELSTQLDFSTLVNSLYNSTTNLTSWNTGTLTYGLRYFIRTRQRGNLKTSDWSDPVIFYTAETTTGTYEVIGAGGGGGGGGSRNPGPDTYGNGGGGGGAGYRVTGSIGILYGQTYSVTVGAGGLKGLGVAAQGASGTIGQVGGQSVIDIYSANGGQPGKPGGMGIYTSQQTLIGYDGEGSPMYSYTSVQTGTIGQGGVGSVNGSSGTAAGKNNSVPGLGGAGGNSPYGGDGGVGGNGGYYGQAGGDGQAGVVVLEYPSSMAYLDTSGATYSVNGGNHRYVWSVAGNYTYALLDNRSIQTPVISVQGGTVDTLRIPVLLGSAFTPINYSDTHQSTSWQIATDAAFANVIASSINNSINKLSWSPAINLAEGATYYARVRYNGTVKTSNWSTSVQFTVKVTPVFTDVNIVQAYYSNIENDMHALIRGNVTGGNIGIPVTIEVNFTDPMNNVNITYTAVVNAGVYYYYQLGPFTTRIDYGGGVYSIRINNWLTTYVQNISGATNVVSARVRFIKDGVYSAWSSFSKIYTAPG